MREKDISYPATHGDPSSKPRYALNRSILINKKPVEIHWTYKNIRDSYPWDIVRVCFSLKKINNNGVFFAFFLDFRHGMHY